MDQRLPLGPAGFTNLDFLLSAEIQETGLSARAKNSYRAAGILYLGELVQRNPSRFLLLANFGRTSLTNTKDVLAQLGLSFGMDVRGWSRERAKIVRSLHLESVRKALAVAQGLFENSYGSVCEEIDAILSAILEGRNRELVGKYWGFVGDKPRTLESVGQEYGMTRERVRQIAQKAEDAVRDMWLPTDNIELALKQLARRAPLSLSEAQGFVSKQEGDPNLTVESLLNAADVFDLPCDTKIVREGDAYFVDKSDRTPSIHEMVIDFRKATSKSGCINIDRMSLRLTGGLDSAQTIKSVLKGLPETIWLDDGHSWAASAAPERSRLGNNIRKVLTVCDGIHVSELRNAVLRYHRISFAPPQAVLLAFASKIAGYEVKDGKIFRPKDFVPFELGELEAVLFDCFRTLGSPLPREKIEDFCIDHRGVNVNSFWVYLIYSPLVQRIAPGIFGLVGAPVPVGTVESLRANRKSDGRTEHGWDSSGGLWYATRLDRVSLHMGMFFLPSFMLELTTGDWSILLPDGTPSGKAEVGEQGIKGLKSTLELSGSEPGDVMRILFDLTKKTAEVQVGDDELFESNPNSELDTSQLELEDDADEGSVQI